MTKQKSFKREVRSRMSKTGERYAAARQTLIERADRRRMDATPTSAETAPTTSDEAAVKATGRTYEEWFGILDAWGAAERPHPEIARWLGDEHAVPGWWRQSITVSYERARGRRALGQRSSGWSVSATKTIAAPLERVYEVVTDEARRAAWLEDAPLTPRSATRPKIARFDWGGGPSRVEISFEELGSAKTRVAVEHTRLRDADQTAEMKTWWRARVAELRALLET